MDERILEQLENVPYQKKEGETALEIIKRLLEEKDELYGWNYSKEEWERINYELDRIKELGLEKLILFCYTLSKIADGCVRYAFTGTEGCSIVLSELISATFSKAKFNLPFERFFNEYRKSAPTLSIYVEQGGKGKILKSLYETYGKSLFIKGKDSDDFYFASSKPFDTEIIKETVIVAKENEEAYAENLSILTSRELSKLGFYSFSITEVESIEYLTDANVTERSILEKKKELFDDCYRNDIEEFELIEELKPYLAYTENKLIYQEQFMEICNKVFNVSYSMADYYRREIAKKKKENVISLKEIIMQKFSNNGEKLFNYFYSAVPYSVSKAYLIACLSYKIEE